VVRAQERHPFPQQERPLSGAGGSGGRAQRSLWATPTCTADPWAPLCTPPPLAAFFQEKIRHRDLRQPNPNPFAAEKEPVLFADYHGGCNYDAALKYIVGKFLQRAGSDGSSSVYTVSVYIQRVSNSGRGGGVGEAPHAAVCGVLAAVDQEARWSPQEGGVLAGHLRH
jgi:hypothetical protein